MPLYPDEVAHVQVRWTTASEPWAAEEAVHAFWVHHHHTTGVTFGPWHAELQHLTNKVVEHLQAHWSAVEAMFSLTAQIVQVKAVHIDGAGHALEVAATDVTDSSLQGSSADHMLPPEVALCLSAYAYEPGTFVVNKGRKRGRQYLPYLTSGALSADGTVSDAHLASWLTGWQAIFNDVQGTHTLVDVDDEYWDFAVVSSIDASWDNVGWVSMDSHFDSQRRRQHQSPSVRRVATISHA